MAGDKLNVHARRRARRLCLQALYQWQMNAAPVHDVLAQHLAEADPKKVDTAYFEQLLRGVVAEVEAVDDLLAPCLDREASRLTPIERAVMRMATWELQHQVDVPYRVVISEAVELTRQFGATEAHKYVNGVLDRLATDLRSVERQAARPAS